MRRDRSGSLRRERIISARAVELSGGTNRPDTSWSISARSPLTSDAIEGTPAAIALANEQADGRDERGETEEVEHAPEPKPFERLTGERDPVGDPKPVGTAAEVDLIVSLSRDHELGIDPRVENSARCVQERGEARSGNQGAGRADDRHGSQALDGGRSDRLGSRNPRAGHRQQGGRDSEIRFEIAGELPADRHQFSTPATTQPQSVARPEELIDRLNVGKTPMLGDRQPRAAHRGVEDMEQLGPARGIVQAEGAGRPARVASGD